jgi:magnesium chelatase subunit I
VFTGMFEGTDTRTVVEWFDLGGTLPLTDNTSAEELISSTHGVQGLRELGVCAGVAPGAAAPSVAAAIDFVLEGLYAQKKIGRSDERGYSAADSGSRRPSRREEQALNEEVRIPSGKKKYYN